MGEGYHGGVGYAETVPGQSLQLMEFSVPGFVSWEHFVRLRRARLGGCRGCTLDSSWRGLLRSAPRVCVILHLLPACFRNLRGGEELFFCLGRSLEVGLVPLDPLDVTGLLQLPDVSMERLQDWDV